MEISEVDRKQRVKQKRKTNEVAAQSFRLGSDHLEKLKKMAMRFDLPQVEILRDLIDEKFRQIEEARRR
jgi:predicted DNA-binding protein